MRWLKKNNEPKNNNEPPKTVPNRNSIMRNEKSDAMPGRRQSSLKSNNQQQRPMRQSQINNTYLAQEDYYYEQNEEEQPVFESPVEQIHDEKVTSKRPSKNPQEKFLTNLVKKHPIITALIAMLILIILILSIVLPLTLVKRAEEREVVHKCPDGVNQPRLDCLPDKNNLVLLGRELRSECSRRKCCWDGSPPVGGPNCAMPHNLGFRRIKTKAESYTNKWLDLFRMNSIPSFTKSDISNLEAKIEMQSDNRLRLRVFPRRNFKNKVQRWNVPSGIQNENVFQPNYRVEMSDMPFSLRVVRNSTNHVIFDTTDSSLIFSSQFIQVTTKLSSPYVFGIGENSKETFMHDMNFKTWPLFASQNHPHNSKERPNLYSQFPMYLNIEPDGSSNVVVFYNSNPSEFYLTPFPSLTFRAIGGILDIYIFTGPTPIQALEQFQQAFGLPKLPPFWSLGLQIGAQKYKDSASLNRFIQRFKSSMLPFDSVLIGTEHMRNNTMFTLSHDFHDLNVIVESLRKDNRAVILKITPGIRNTTQNYPFSDSKTSREKYWIMENFFSAGAIGLIDGVDVVYPDFTLEKTKRWWLDAFERFIIADRVIQFDGLFLDYLTPVDQRPNKTCSNNKWNFPPYKPDALAGQNLFENTICMDSRYDLSKHYNIHGMYSHAMIEATAKMVDMLFHTRTLVMSRHAFIGSGKYGAKWLGEYKAEWDDFRRSVVGTIEMNMFGFAMSGGDVCGFKEDEFDSELCENWIKAGSMSPLMKLTVNSDSDDDARFNRFMQKDMFEILNSTLILRYSLIPYFYTQFSKATKYGTLPVRPLAFEFPQDQRTYKINNQWLWGDKLMVTIGTSQGGVSSTYLPKGEWYDYYKGFIMRSSNGEFVNVISRRNETNLLIRGGSIIHREDCRLTALDSKNTFVDIIIALNQTDNFTASGELYMDDSKRKDTHRKMNYHKLIYYKVYRDEMDGLIEVHRKSGTYRTNLAYRDLFIYGLKSKPTRFTVNENTQAVDSSKCVWDNTNMVYHVNLQTEVKKKVLLDNEYLSFRWTGGFEQDFNNNVNRANVPVKPKLFEL